MKLEELKEQIKTDLFIDQAHLADAAANNSLLGHKYRNMLADYRLQYRREWVLLQKAKKKSYRYYMGYEMSCPPETLDARGVKIHVEADDEVLDIEKKMFVLEEKIKYLEDTCSSFVSRGFNIKNIIEVIKFQQGL